MPKVPVGEELVITTRVSFDELALRVQALENVISRIPIIGPDYKAELRRAGLERRDLIMKTSVRC